MWHRTEIKLYRHKLTGINILYVYVSAMFLFVHESYHNSISEVIWQMLSILHIFEYTIEYYFGFAHTVVTIAQTYTYKISTAVSFCVKKEYNR